MSMSPCMKAKKGRFFLAGCSNAPAAAAPPTVTITSHTDNDAMVGVVVFTGVANDALLGDVSANIVWTSSAGPVLGDSGNVGASITHSGGITSPTDITATITTVNGVGVDTITNLTYSLF